MAGLRRGAAFERLRLLGRDSPPLLSSPRSAAARRRLALLLEYDGSDFVGWQKQANGRSVQGTLEAVVAEVFREKATITGSGRTDSGVHAHGQVAHLDLHHPLAISRIPAALNSRLPQDVQIIDAAEVPFDFDARRSARRRRYAYRLVDGTPKPVLTRGWMAWTPYRLDVDAMSEAAAFWLGRHDFSSFRAIGCVARSAVRTVESIHIHRVEDPPLWRRRPIVITVTSRSFLRGQIRAMVGTLMEIGRGRRSVAWAKKVLEARARSEGGPSAPAEGLSLETVEFDRPIFAPPSSGKELE